MDKPPYPAEDYYRVAVKALIFDEHKRLLVLKDRRGEWEIPGGGMAHVENYQACLKRELAEEMAVEVKYIEPLAFFYRHETQHGHPKISLAFPVQLESSDLAPTEDDIAETRFVTQAEFLLLPFQKSETPVKQYADQIWQTAQAD